MALSCNFFLCGLKPWNAVKNTVLWRKMSVFCSPKDIKAITGRRVEMVVTVNNIKGSKRVGGVWADEVKTYYNTTFNDVNGKYICSHSVECGGYNVCVAVVVVSNNRPRRSMHLAKRVNAPAVANHKPP